MARGATWAIDVLVRAGIEHSVHRKAALADPPTIFASAGQRGLQVELAPADLFRTTNAVVAPFAGAL